MGIELMPKQNREFEIKVEQTRISKPVVFGHFVPQHTLLITHSTRHKVHCISKNFTPAIHHRTRLISLENYLRNIPRSSKKH